MADKQPERRPTIRVETSTAKDGIPLRTGGTQKIVLKSPLTLWHLATTLKMLEEQGKNVVAHRFLRQLDYAYLTDLARKGVAARSPKNDPNLLPEELRRVLTRSVLLWGMKIAHYPSVRRLHALLLDCFPELADDEAFVKEASEGVFLDATLEAYTRWRDAPSGEQAAARQDSPGLGGAS